MGIELTSNFDVKTALPLDSRLLVADITARDAIENLHRYEGMIVYVKDEKTNYQLVGGVTNSDWQELSGSGAGGGGGGIALRDGPIPPMKVINQYDEYVYEFENDTNQSLVGSFTVPQGYKPGTQVFVKVTGYWAGANTEENLTMTSKIYRPGVSSPGGGSSYVSTNAPVAQGLLPRVNSFLMDVCDANGEVSSGTALEPGDEVHFVISRDLGDSGNSLFIYMDTVEVRYA
jgi:hypothetical protein